ncbi:type II secretion system F family protein [Cellulomonas sp. zg-ZUI222]|uniref:Type II secretion system F family protein n=1 Tax=Cellulomonas wangleii TaxID=2816956 RepID=A0ABX8DBF5_9CELL|nr:MULTISPECIES: type II secretion system F family protein [Cellulomonas]MBO0900957.1 type II secretion system F family protein [Cellulomonas sp. zg-ZUI22]MBO0921612.1 type II secretion system F family protein [Cellulomonas wangleii]MBO0925108.1 type II secretion system F family protein [Cellulomonas wangleii]QVI63482.1 type II secretion system F family protein [Cellulomonas wangleii]
MSPRVLGALAGLLLGSGLVLVALRLGARRITLDQRVGPYLRTRGTSSLLRAEAARGPWATVDRLVAPFLADGVRLVARLGSPAADVRRRLARAGRHETVEQLRAQQVVSGVVGLAVGLLAAVVLAATRGAAVVPLVALVAVCGLLGALVPDWLVGRQVARREARLLAQMPTVTELLALAVSAGEGATGALERVVRQTHGELADELARTLADARAGTPLTGALQALADRTGLPALARFAEGVAVAVERGSPLADVLRAQAQDVREEGRRALMQTGGRKEVLMMVPVVFLILPVTVLFAVFPSAVVLRVGL